MGMPCLLYVGELDPRLAPMKDCAQALANAHIDKATLKQKENLAAMIHLCGAGAGERYARRGLRLVAQQRCGDHDVRAYLNRVQGMKTVFLRLAADS